MQATKANKKEHGIQKHASLLEAIILACVPLTLVLCAVFQVEHSAILSLFVGVVSLVIFFLSFEKQRPPLKQVMPTITLAALAAAGRIIFAPFYDVKPVSAICIIAGIVFGKRSGFLVGSLAALVSNFFFGQGPWTPWQMYSWGLVGYVAGVLAAKNAFAKKPVLYAYAFLSAFMFGLFMNGWYVIGFVHPITWESVVLAYAAGFPFDCVHAIATVAFLLLLYEPWRKKLARIVKKYDLVDKTF